MVSDLGTGHSIVTVLLDMVGWYTDKCKQTWCYMAKSQSDAEHMVFSYSLPWYFRSFRSRIRSRSDWHVPSRVCHCAAVTSSRVCHFERIFFTFRDSQAVFCSYLISSTSWVAAQHGTTSGFFFFFFFFFMIHYRASRGAEPHVALLSVCVHVMCVSKI